MSKKKIKKIIINSLPIALGYISLGFMGGAMIQKSGFNLIEIMLFSVLVFSGSAVFIAANVLQAGIYPQVAITLTATIIIMNLRNILYSSSLACENLPLKGWKRVLFSQFVADETFALNKIMLHKDPEWDSDCALYINILGGIYGLIGNALGGYFGEIIDIPLDLGFFMMSSMFVILLVLQINNKLDVFMIAISAIISYLILSIYQGGLDLIIIALIVTTIGYFLDKSNEKRMVSKNE
ncbi:AzlC family ABC transporter permease [Peptostreptococcus faecalis]|uniref:AzlC family ABC transporter permease n=1 Tax=Peptostreptococcus faecalis TaxID=2045015 RepID=UPI000C7D2C32|nr:AzlC family ABC transporter permease [Peptostreptococcus faecalis]